MSSFSTRSVRWLARLLAARPPVRDDVMPGIDVALDGETAVAVAEGLWCDVACLGASFPGSVAARAWAKRADGINALGARARAIQADSGPGALAAAIGASSAGARATAFLSGQDLGSCGELLHQAAGRRLPLVVHVATRATAGHAVTFGAGHDAWYAAADAGWMQLFANNVQEAVDLALVARVAAEQALVPVMIGVDGPETALAAQDVLLPEPALVRELLRDPGTRIAPPTPAQRIIFGEYRETVPRWHDLDEPGLLGGVEDARWAPQGMAAGALYFASHARACLADATERVGKRTGRHLDAIEAHATRDADVVIVVVGSSFEAACVATERLRSVEKLKIGVVGVRCCRPWPRDAFLEATRKASKVVVLERAESALASHGALTREIIATLATRSPLPHVCSVFHGIGGVSAPPHAIAQACARAVQDPFEVVRLGVTVSATDSTSPKREAVLDAVRRDYPDIERTALPIGPSEGRHVPNSMRIAIRRAAGAEDEAFAGQAAALLHALGGGRLRSLPSMRAPVHGVEAIDVLEFGDGVSTPAPEFADVGVLVSGEHNPPGDPLRMVGSGSALLVALDEEGGVTRGVRQDVLARAQNQQVRLVAVPVPPPRAYERPAPAWRRHEALLGALVSICADRLKGPSITCAKAAAARERLLEDVGKDQRSERLAAFRKGFEGHAAIAEDAVAPASVQATKSAPRSAPAFSGRPVKSPAEHWARVGSLAAKGRSDDCAADPFAACGVTPAGSSERRVIDDGGIELLEFDPENCDGSSDCWVGCPDGSVVALALGAKAILDAGVQLVASAGGSADALSPITTNLGRVVHKSALNSASPPTTVLEACEAAYHTLIEKAAPDEERRRAIDGAFKAVMEAIGMLPIARTPLLFDELEHAKAGSGAFLIVGVRPDATRDARAAAGDGLGHGLRLVERTPARLERARALWRMHEALPDTSGEVIAHAIAQAPIGPMGGVLLSRSCSMAMATGDDAEPGSGERLAARLVIAACEAEVQPRVQRFLEEVRGLRERMGARIHETLAGALPDSDLDALAQGLQALGREDVELAELGRHVSGATESGRLDTAALSRLVDAGRALADLEWRLTEGPTAHGRARFGGAVALGSGTMWAGAAPFSPFRAPLVVDVGVTAPELSRGLLEGQATAAIEAIRVVRWAKDELDKPGGAEQRRLRALGWDDLNEQERGICPPLLLLGDDESLTRGALGSLLWLLSTDLPVKVVLLSGGGGRADTGSGVDAFGSYPAGAGIDVGLLAMLARKAYVVQTSVGAPTHLAEGVRGALKFAGPALIHVHAPSPGRHGFPPTQTLDHARLAVASRAFPLFRFDPAAAGVFGTCLDLSGNPAPEETLANNQDGKALTPLDWLITETRFRERFRPPDAKEATTNADQALIEPPAERGATPIQVLDPLDRSAWVASAEAIAFADDRLRLWRTLQELGGLVTPFTRRVREDAERSIAEERQREIDDLQRQHQAALAELQAGFESESVTRVREGLLALAGYGQREDEQK